MYVFSVYVEGLKGQSSRTIDTLDDAIHLPHQLLALLVASDSYWADLDEYGFVHFYTVPIARVLWTRWGCLPDEDLLVSAMRETDILRRSPRIGLTPRPLTANAPTM